jgi:outer membrane protein
LLPDCYDDIFSAHLWDTDNPASKVCRIVINILITLKGKTMKKTLLAVLYVCITVCFIAGPVNAADIKIGIIDTQKIVTDSKAGKAAQVVFNKDLETKQVSYNAKQKELQTIQDELTAKGKDMTATVYSEKTAKYSKVKKELERMKSETEEDLKARNTELNRKLYAEIAAIVSDYCKKEKFTLILEKTYVAAYDGTIDITDKIIQLYDTSKDAATSTTK